MIVVVLVSFGEITLRQARELESVLARACKVPGAKVRGQPHIPPILVQTQSSVTAECGCTSRTHVPFCIEHVGFAGHSQAVWAETGCQSDLPLAGCTLGIQLSVILVKE